MLICDNLNYILEAIEDSGHNWSYQTFPNSDKGHEPWVLTC